MEQTSDQVGGEVRYCSNKPLPTHNTTNQHHQHHNTTTPQHHNATTPPQQHQHRHRNNFHNNINTSLFIDTATFMKVCCSVLYCVLNCVLLSTKVLLCRQRSSSCHPHHKANQILRQRLYVALLNTFLVTYPRLSGQRLPSSRLQLHNLGGYWLLEQLGPWWQHHPECIRILTSRSDQIPW